MGLKMHPKISYIKTEISLPAEKYPENLYPLKSIKVISKEIMKEFVQSDLKYSEKWMCKKKIKKISIQFYLLVTLKVNNSSNNSFIQEIFIGCYYASGIEDSIP